MTQALQRQIGWEKWRDPFGSDTHEAEWPGAHGTFLTDEILDRAMDEDTDLGLYDPEEIEKAAEEHQRQAYIKARKNQTRILSTPMGVFPLNEHTNAATLFDFWTAHTNFRMTKALLDIIDNTDGVESLDIYTPYRWRISVGKAFESSVVKDTLMKNLNAIPVEIKEN